MKNQYQQKWEENKLVELYDKFRKFIDSAEKEYIAQTIIEIKKHFKAQKTKKIKILDIGAGAGHSTIPLLKKLSEEFIIEYDYLDVSTNQKKEFIKEIKKQQLKNLLNNFWISSWESFSEKTKYDLILSYHSWYGIENWKNKKLNTLLKIKNYLGSKGIGIIVLNSKESITQQIMAENSQGIISSEDIIESMKKFNIFFLKKSLFYDKFNKKNFIEKGNIKKQAKPFFSYLYRKSFEDLDNLEIKKIKKLLSLRKKEDKFFKIPCDIIEIFK